MAPMLVRVAGGLCLGAAWWAASRLFHHALLRGPRAPRVPHDPQGPYGALRDLQSPAPGGAVPPGPALQALRLATGQGKQLAAWVAWPVPRPPGPLPAVL